MKKCSSYEFCRGELRHLNKRELAMFKDSEHRQIVSRYLYCPACDVFYDPNDIEAGWFIGVR